MLTPCLKDSEKRSLGPYLPKVVFSTEMEFKAKISCTTQGVILRWTSESAGKK